MRRVILYVILVLVPALAGLADSSAQAYRRETRRGNRDLSEGAYEKAREHYRKAYSGDSLIAAYNLATALHLDRTDSAKVARNDTLALESLDEVKNLVKDSRYEADYYFNHGVVAASIEDWQTAVEDFKRVMLLRPDDMAAKENYVYAKEHLQKNPNGGGGGGNNDQQQDQNDQQQDQNDQQQDQNDQQHDQNDLQQDQNDQQQDQNDQQQDQNDQQQGQNDQPQDKGGQPQEPKISPQQAQQILQAIQAKEKETQEKVNKNKAEAMKSKQKEKNW